MKGTSSKSTGFDTRSVMVRVSCPEQSAPRAKR